MKTNLFSPNLFVDIVFYHSKRYVYLFLEKYEETFIHPREDPITAKETILPMSNSLNQ